MYRTGEGGALSVPRRSKYLDREVLYPDVWDVAGSWLGPSRSRVTLRRSPFCKLRSVPILYGYYGQCERVYRWCTKIRRVPALQSKSEALDLSGQTSDSQRELLQRERRLSLFTSCREEHPQRCP